jgi:hypothetical protein
MDNVVSLSLSLEAKLPKHEADHSPLFRIEDENSISLPAVLFYGRTLKHRGI